MYNPIYFVSYMYVTVHLMLKTIMSNLFFLIRKGQKKCRAVNDIQMEYSQVSSQKPSKYVQLKHVMRAFVGR